MNKKKKKSEMSLSLWQQIYYHKSSYFMIAPFVVLFTIFFILPVIASLLLGFTYFDGVRMPKFIGLENYVTMFANDNVFIIGLKNTMIMAILTGPLSFILCFILAWLINEFPRRIRTVLTLVFFLPSLVGNAVIQMIQVIFHDDVRGYANSLLIYYKLIPEKILWFRDTKYNFILVVVIQIWMSLGAGFLTHIAGLQTIDPEIYEAGVIDGVKNRFQELFYITYPMMKPFLFFSAVIQIAAAFNAGGIAITLGGLPSNQWSLHTIISHIQYIGVTRFELGYASAVSFVLTVIMIAVKSGITKLFGSKAE